MKASAFSGTLPVMKDSVEVLKEMNQKYEIFIVSAAMEFPNSLKDKLRLASGAFSLLQLETDHVVRR